MQKVSDNNRAVCESGKLTSSYGQQRKKPFDFGSIVASLKLLTEFRLVAFQIEPNSKGFFTSAVLRRHNSAQGGVTARTKLIRRRNGTLSQYQNETEGASNKHQLCSHGVAN